MKNPTTYDIVPVGTRVISSYQGDHTCGDLFSVIKTPQFGHSTIYEVTLSPIASSCSCPGGTHHTTCKHIAMVLHFKQTSEPQS